MPAPRLLGAEQLTLVAHDDRQRLVVAPILEPDGARSRVDGNRLNIDSDLHATISGRPDYRRVTRLTRTGWPPVTSGWCEEPDSQLS